MTSITINGRVLTLLEKSYEDNITVYAQFLMESEAKGMEVLKVKITNKEDTLKLQKDMVVSIPVSIVSMNGNLYYSQVEAIKYLKEMK